MELNLPEHQPAGKLVWPEQREHGREKKDMKVGGRGQIMLGPVGNCSGFGFYIKCYMKPWQFEGKALK